MKKIVTGSLLACSLLSQPLLAQEIDITLQNITHGIHFTPFIVAAHDSDTSLFMLGEAASTELQAMAEGGDISGLSTQLTAVSAVIVENPAAGLLAPGASFTASMDTGDKGYLSLTAMLLPTNDGFVGLSQWPIPDAAGTYVVYLNAYDAGTEANDEIINGGGAPGVAGIPVAPGGDGGTGATGVTATENNQTVHIHRGNLGDDDPNGGSSDLDNRVHRWLNPVAKLVITVK